MFCQYIQGRNESWYAHFFMHPGAVKMCGSEPVLKVVVKELPKEVPGCYWAFWEEKSQEFQYVYPVKQLVEICFHYGIKAEEEKGNGRLLPVAIIEDKQ